MKSPLELACQMIFEILLPKSCVICRNTSSYLCEPCGKRLIEIVTKCAYCGKASGNGICRPCEKKRSIEKLTWVSAYKNPPAREVIAHFKYQGVRGLAPMMARLMVSAMQGVFPENLEDYLLIPIPLYPAKERLRGFNQAELLATKISHYAGIPLLERGVFARIRNTPPQVKAGNAKDRIAHIRGAFLVNDASQIKGKDLIIIDDVTTTGSTLSEAGKTLLHAGAKSVSGVVFARG